MIDIIFIIAITFFLITISKSHISNEDSLKSWLCFMYIILSYYLFFKLKIL